jgi:demethylmenaquinone methyltransferase/2-methoxy-6-polyprenyl-1,4-benzoquinol methylase
MEPELRQSMFRYYDERAAEYEEAYVLGTGTASIPDSEVFLREATLLTEVVERFARGRIVDLACGTGYWLPYYAPRCSTITLIDQSLRMLDECRKKTTALHAGDRTAIVQGDVFEHAFDQGTYDSALVGFLISHLTDAEERLLFGRLKAMLDVEGRFLILDSAWSLERARFNAKIGRQERRLNDGTVSMEHLGTAFLAVSGAFQG